MSPLDYVAPVQVESAAVSPDAVTDEMEWLSIESQCFRCGNGVLLPPSDAKMGKSAAWLGPKVTGPKLHPKGCRLKGESSFGSFPSPAASPDMAQRHFDLFPTVRFTPAQYGPYYRGEPSHMRHSYPLRPMTYREKQGVWK